MDKRGSSNPDIIDAYTVAEMLDISHKTVLNHCKKGIIPHRRIGSLYRFHRKEIEKLLPSVVPSENDGTLSERFA